jgi:hypothetical protein
MRAICGPCDALEGAAVLRLTRYANSCGPYLLSQRGSFGLSAIRAAFDRDILANQVKIFIVEHNSIVAAARQTLLRKREQPF